MTKGIKDAEGHGSNSVARGYLEAKAGCISASASLIESVRELMHSLFGASPHEGHVAVVLPAAAGEHPPADYDPLGQRLRSAPEPPPDEEALLKKLATDLVRHA